MDVIDLRASYFAIPNPLRWLERWRHQYRHEKQVALNGRTVRVRWTERADTALHGSQTPLVVELQLYFSCVVKKRVLFHPGPAGFDPVAVDDRFGLVFQPVASAACDPEKFAASYPRGKQLSGDRARRMLPRRVELDYRRGNWEGQFHF